MPHPQDASDFDLSIVIVNWNTRELLRACLASLPLGVAPEHAAEVWVIDNHSQDRSAEMVSRGFPQAHLIANEQNVGFARANNQAIRRAGGRHVLLLNSDTVVGDESLSAMVRFLDDHPQAGAVGCRLENADGSTQRSSWSHYPSLATLAADAFYLWRMPGVRRWAGRYEPSLAGPTEPTQVKHLLGACLMVRREALDAVGPMDEGYFMYLEETDWCRRLDAAGWQVVYLPSASIVHYGQQSAGLAPDRANADWCRSLCRFFRRHYGPAPLRIGLLKAIVSISLFVRFVLNGARSLSGRSAKPRPSLQGYFAALRALAAA